eukprot:symbB.v1.2.022056.t1/scaffold1941.1/size95522/2
MWKRKAEERSKDEEGGSSDMEEVEVEVEVEVEEEDTTVKEEVLNPPKHGAGQFVTAPPVERSPAHPLRPVDPTTARPKAVMNSPGGKGGSFLARKSAELAQRDLTCKAICRVKRGLRLGGTNGRPFIPEDWDTTFKPSLGSYIRFLLSRPDQFKVTEGAGPGLFTLEDITGNEVLTHDEVTAAKGKKGKTKKGDPKGSPKSGSKGSAKGKGSGTKGSVSAGKVGGKVSAKGGVLKGRTSQAGKGITLPTSRAASSKGKLVKAKPQPPSTPPFLISRLRASDDAEAAVSEAEDEEPEPADGLGWKNDFDQEAEEAAAMAAAEKAFQDDAVEELELQPATTWKRSSLIAALLT